MSDCLVEAFRSKTHGRGLRAKRDIKPGELLLRDKPFSYVLYHSESLNPSFCDYCFAEKGKSLLRCSGCRFVRYCDKKCQKSAWSDHKDECRSLVRAKSKNIPIFSDQMRLTAKTQWKQKPLVDDPSIPALDPEGFPNIPYVLEKHNDQWGAERKEAFEKSLLQLSHYMSVDYIKDTSQMQDLFSILQANCVEISDGELHNIGYGLYLKMAFLNHACDFNCVATFNGTTLDMRATKDIKKGEECFMSYTEVYSPTEERNKQTTKLWCFSCNCKLCEDKDRDAKITAIKCGNSQCSTPIPFYYMKTDPSYRVKCPSCTWNDKVKTILERNWATVKKMRKNKLMLERLRKNLELCDWSIIKTLAETNLSVGAAIFHHQNFMMIENLDIAMDACVHLELWDTALNYGLQSLGPYREFYPEYHPAIGVQCMRVGKLHLYLQQLPEAQKMLLQAHHIIHVSHGDDHPLMKTLKELLFNCEEEMRVNRMQSLSEVEDVD